MVEGVLRRTAGLASGRSGTTGTTELWPAEILVDGSDPAALEESRELLALVEPAVVEMSFFRDRVFRYMLCRARVAAYFGEQGADHLARAALDVLDDGEPGPPPYPDVGRPSTTAEERAWLDDTARRP